jgi:hypothetical protein
MQAENKVRLVVLGFDCSPEHISTLLGVEPTKSWLKGEPVHPRATNTHAENGWMRASPSDPTVASAEEGIRALLQLFQDPTVFARLPKQSTVQLTCTLFGYEYRPYVYVPAELVRTIATIGASIDIDTYDLSDERESRNLGVEHQ